MNDKKYIFLIFKVLVTSLLFYLIISNVNMEDVFMTMKNVNPIFWLFACLVALLQLIIANIRWSIVLKQLNIGISKKKLFSYLWIGMFFNQALPSSIGGDALRVLYLHKNTEAGVNKSTLSVLLDRAMGITGLVILIVFSTPYLYQKVGYSNSFLGVIFLLVLLALGIFTMATTDLFFKFREHWKVINLLHQFSKQVRRLLLTDFNGLKLVLISILVHSLSVIIVILIAESLRINVEYLNIFLVIPLAILLMTIPISIAGWGIRESVMVAGLGYVGLESEYALALSIMYGVLLLVLSLPGMLIWVLNRRK
jgi:glycosyltransferase 2 family protein